MGCRRRVLIGVLVGETARPALTWSRSVSDRLPENGQKAWRTPSQAVCEVIIVLLAVAVGCRE